MFTIADLIKELQKMPQDAIVARDRSHCWNDNPVPYRGVKSRDFKDEVRLENVKGINYLLVGSDPIDY